MSRLFIPNRQPQMTARVNGSNRAVRALDESFELQSRRGTSDHDEPRCHALDGRIFDALSLGVRGCPRVLRETEKEPLGIFRFLVREDGPKQPQPRCDLPARVAQIRLHRASQGRVHVAPASQYPGENLWHLQIAPYPECEVTPCRIQLTPLP